MRVTVNAIEFPRKVFVWTTGILWNKLSFVMHRRHLIVWMSRSGIVTTGHFRATSTIAEVALLLQKSHESLLRFTSRNRVVAPLRCCLLLRTATTSTLCGTTPTMDMIQFFSHHDHHEDTTENDIHNNDGGVVELTNIILRGKNKFDSHTWMKISSYF